VETRDNVRRSYLFSQYVNLVEGWYIVMAQKGKKSDVKRQGNELIWVNIPLSDEHKNDLGTRVVNASELLAEISSLVVGGYSFSIRTNFEGTSIIASLTCATTGICNNGHGLSGYGTTPEDAILSLLYKHFTVASEDWTQFKTIGKSRFS
jgi:hypothetical protein